MGWDKCVRGRQCVCECDRICACMCVCVARRQSPWRQLD